MSKPFAWSYSALTSYETCPRRHKILKITKQVVEPQGVELLHGNRVHKAMEDRVKFKTPLPTDMVQYEPIVASMEAKGGYLEAEQKLCLNINLQPTAYFAKDAWVRGIADVTLEKRSRCMVGDYKTGKPTPASEQLALSAAMVFAHKDYIETVDTAFLWLKTGGVTMETYERDDIPRIWSSFLPRVNALERAIAEDKFPPRPSGLCRKWCPVGKSLCEHCGD